MGDLRYFAEGDARAPGEETVPEPADDEAVVFEEFFAAGLRMPPHSALAEILWKFRVQLHQLTPNAIAQLSKYFWAVVSFGGIPTGDSFTKRYELHYQPKKIKVGEAVLNAQFGCLNFHAKRYKDSRAKLTVAVKNKWSLGYTKVWFYCKVPIHRSPHG
jgi:hypothetical protein